MSFVIIFGIFLIVDPLPILAQWQPCQGFYGGSIRTLGGNSNVLFAASPGGLYKSFDKGLNWLPAYYGIEEMTVDKLAVSGNTVIVSTIFDGIFISHDLGDSWQVFNNTFTHPEIASVFVVNTRIFISFEYGTSMTDPLYKSDDNGYTWQSVSTGLQTYVNDYTLLGNDIYIAANNGVFVSFDSGLTWQARKNGLPTFPGGGVGWTDQITSLGSALIAVSDAEPGIPTPFLMVSVDSGLSWQAYNTDGFSNNTFPGEIVNIGDKLIAPYQNGLLISSDTGRTWTTYNNGILQSSNPYIQPIFEEGGKLYIGGYFLSLLYSADTGQTWIPRYNGIMGIYTGAVGYYGNNIFVSPQNCETAYISTDQGNTWDTINPIFTDKITAFETHDSTIIAGSNFPSILLSKDGGLNWNWDGPGAIGLGNTKYYDIMLDPPYIFLLNTLGVYRSPDNGLTWVNISSFFSLTATSITKIGNRYVVVTEGSGVYYSDNNGVTWSHTVSGIPYSSLPIYTYTGLYGIEEKDGLLFTGSYDEGVLMSADSGVHWTISSNGLPTGTPFNNTGFIYCMTKDSANIYVGSLENGVYFSPDNAQNWYPCNLGLPSKKVYYLVKTPTLLLASTLNNGLWKLNTQSIGVNIPSADTVNTEMLRIIPNPITSYSVLIVNGIYNVSSLSVYDILGHEIFKKSITGNQFNIGAENLKSGVYIVKVLADKKQLTKKIIVD